MNLNSSHAGRSLTSCEQEPIHIPGLIQPFGILMSVRELDLTILQVSQNVKHYLGVEVEALLGTSISDLFLEDISKPILLGNKACQSPYWLKLTEAATQKAFKGRLHRQIQGWILELEPLEKDSVILESFFEREIQLLYSVQGARSLEELCQIAVTEIQEISEYDRVMVYRFDANWNGQVIAEAKTRRVQDTYLGHHFPASDIPAQARAVFLQNWVRMIPDVNYQAVPLIPALHPETQTPLDLGRAFLRSVSPIHVQYLKNMNVGGTLTISLIEEGKLWGIIACHHQKAHFLQHEVRIACEFIGRLVSAHLSLQATREDSEYKFKLRGISSRLLEFMASEEDLVQGLIRHSPNLLDLVGAEGAAAAIHFEGSWCLVGETPSENQIEKLASWLNEKTMKDEIFYTDRLPLLYPEAQSYKDRASGLLAISIPKTDRSFILCFRPEVLQSVTWAGNPKKNVERLADGTLKIEPRASFESWKEEVKDHSLPWKAVEVEIATELRHAILGLDLNRQFKKEQKARGQAEKMSREKEDLLATVSHDLKNPLTAIRLTIQMLNRKYQKEIEKSDPLPVLKDISQASGKIEKIVHRMERLIHDLLDIAKIEGGRFMIEPKAQDLIPLISEVVTLLVPIAQAKKISLSAVTTKDPCIALFDDDRLLQVLSNVVGNAIKFTPENGFVKIKVTTQDSQISVRVEDTGPGIPPDQLPHVFDRFWQASRTQRMGTGLGLAISKGIVDAHGGSIGIDSEVGKGSCVTLTLPVHAPVSPQL